MSEKPAILYVDDEEANLLLFRISFEGDREVLVANTPEEGLEKLKQNQERIRAVISDMHMPRMNGVQFIKKAQETVSNIPYFILSGYAFNDEIDEAMQEKIIRNFFTKPFNRSEIEEQLKAASGF
ncbi:response regulator [Ekhidna sp.]|uniref:response regulator n=1 Tax=Ekhidna sp. TaxID=2608089 RepID=UPI0035151804